MKSKDMACPVFRILIFLLAAMTLCISDADVHAAQQYQGLCARVKLEILQEMTLERVGFLATLKITNNEGDAPITDFSATLTFENPELSTEDQTNDSSGMFFVKPPELSGINAIDGTGMIPAGQTAVIKWFIIPKIAAGGESAAGVRYQVGAILGGSIYGEEISQDVLKVIPDTIFVKPEPQLEITYFQPRDVEGDDPFTLDVVETPVPFTVGVIVKNSGYGIARKVKIKSQQPRIVENREGLLLIARLLGVQVNDSPLDQASLTVDLGDIPPAGCSKGAWKMITSLSGEFIEFKATYTHASELGGEETSVIKSMNAYFISHEVRNDQPGRDDILDFLADTDGDSEHLPDTLYESDCNVVPVNVLRDVTVSGDSASARVVANADVEGWVYFRVDDPAQAKLPIVEVVRSDGKVLDPANYWTNIRYRKPDNQKETFLNIFDFVGLGQYEYDVVYDTSSDDTEPPVTTLRFSGEYSQSDGRFYVAPETMLYFTVDDQSPTATYYRLDGAGDFLPAYPFQLSDDGEHLLEFYSEDSAGNSEDVQSVQVVLATTPPEIVSMEFSSDEFFHGGDLVSLRPGSVRLSFEGSTSSVALDAAVDVFQGVQGWATLSGVPSSPVSDTSASITVGGENVDYYIYRLGDGNWSDERPVNDTLELQGLSGNVTLSVKGRSQFGDYPSESVDVSWLVDGNAPPLRVSASWPQPAYSSDLQLEVSGADKYRFALDGSYYHAEADISAPVVLHGLTPGRHTVSVFGFYDGAWHEDEKVEYSFMVVPNYGTDCSALPQVRHAEFSSVDSARTWAWDGRNDDGGVLPPGWYTIRLTLTDDMHRSSARVHVIHLGDFMPAPVRLGTAAPAGEPFASRGWLVWEDQRNGNWDIYARRLEDNASEEIRITDSPLNQMYPSTDGNFVVWQTRRANGTWDIAAQRLNDGSAAFDITSTPDTDETNPVVDYPWIIYQARPAGDPNAPWQLMAYNMNSGEVEAVDPSEDDQIDPAIDDGRVVWQDFRGPGYGDIYLKFLETGEVIHVTSDADSQYHPVISGNWVVWSDKRDVQNDLYGFNLLRSAEVRLTSTPEDETLPFINGQWVIYRENSGDPVASNLRMLYLGNLASLQLTSASGDKTHPVLASGFIAWEENSATLPELMLGRLPDLQPVFNNTNIVAVTQGMADRMHDAFTILRLWHDEAGVEGITRIVSLDTAPVTESATWEGGAAAGVNFQLQPGTFLWVRFDSDNILDLGQSGCNSLDLSAGSNVFSYWCWPDGISAYALIKDIGIDKVNSVRMLDSATGKWRMATVIDGAIRGEDFSIPRIAVVMIDMKEDVTGWQP